MAGTVPAHSRDGALTASDDASHSESALYHLADHTLDGLVPSGAVVDRTTSGGHVIGLREGDRAIPTFSITLVGASSLSAFDALILGVTSGFVSTTLDIGDAKAVDLVWSFPYGAEQRAYSMEDCVCTGHGHKAGSPSNSKTYNFEVNGIVKARDTAGNWTTIIAAR